MIDAIKTKRIAFIQACWHKEIIDQSRKSFFTQIEKLGISSEQIDVYEVPGSLEIPLQAKLLAKTQKYKIMIAAGLIVDGGIYRHEFVADTVLKAMMTIQLETEVPILSLVLTPINFHENETHKEFFHGHFKIKGIEAANSCAQTIKNIEALSNIQ